MREIIYPNAIVRLHGEINIEKLKDACVRYVVALDRAQREKEEKQNKGGGAE